MPIYLSRKAMYHKTYKMWAWLAKHPIADKSDYFRKHSVMNAPAVQCYVCQYVEDTYSYARVGHFTDREQCLKHCPLKALWTKGCERGRSPYLRWRDNPSNLVLREAAALKIADFCKKKLAPRKT